MTVFPEDYLTENAFLGGALRLLQPKDGYRAGIDPVLLAAACPAKAGDTVLDLGCGGGIAGLCLARRVPGIDLTGVELQPAYADLARRNANLNAIPATIVEADLRDLPAALRQRQFTHVIANPPYFERSKTTPSTNPGRATARSGEATLADWIDTAARRLAPRGALTLIQKPDRLPQILAALEGRLGSMQIAPLAPRAGRDPNLVLVRAVKDGRAPLRLAAPLPLHDGPEHLSDTDDYTQTISKVLRKTAPLPLWN
ncbi:tRNA1(Val) (adenine(37)-N6)-methyltransferase [Aestuariibius insulae]|uniref:tRNA1(Val) (adenine(37)-N6)-methyltransferase n=1 Tax=Aestuariibius insulae TaxID=2058287 RepID=UPI00345E2BE6